MTLVCAVIAFYFGRKLQVENFDKIEVGMTEREVERLLGGSPGHYGRKWGPSLGTAEGGIYGKRREVWTDDNTMLEVQFDDENRVIDKHKRAGYQRYSWIRHSLRRPSFSRTARNSVEAFYPTWWYGIGYLTLAGLLWHVQHRLPRQPARLSATALVALSMTIFALSLFMLMPFIDGFLFAPACVGAAIGTLVAAVRFRRIRFVIRATMGGALGGAIGVGGTFLAKACLALLAEGYLTTNNLDSFMSDFVTYSFIGCLIGTFVALISGVVYVASRFAIERGRQHNLVAVDGDGG